MTENTETENAEEPIDLADLLPEDGNEDQDPFSDEDDDGEDIDAAESTDGDEDQG